MNEHVAVVAFQFPFSDEETTTTGWGAMLQKPFIVVRNWHKVEQ